MQRGALRLCDCVPLDWAPAFSGCDVGAYAAAYAALAVAPVGPGAQVFVTPASPVPEISASLIAAEIAPESAAAF